MDLPWGYQGRAIEHFRFVAALRNADRPEFKWLLETAGADGQHERVEEKSDSPATSRVGHMLDRLGTDGRLAGREG